MRMTQEQQREALAQIHDIRRRLAERNFAERYRPGPPPVPDDPDAPDAEVIEITEREKEKRYDAEHPVMRRRRDIDG